MFLLFSEMKKCKLEMLKNSYERHTFEKNSLRDISKTTAKRYIWKKKPAKKYI